VLSNDAFGPLHLDSILAAEDRRRTLYARYRGHDPARFEEGVIAAMQASGLSRLETLTELIKASEKFVIR
jgi:hypothetical protein